MLRRFRVHLFENHCAQFVSPIAFPSLELTLKMMMKITFQSFVIAGLLITQSTNAQTTLSPFYEQDYEDVSVSWHGYKLEGGSGLFHGWARHGGYSESHRSDRIADGIGNPGKAGEMNVDFSWDGPNEDAPVADRFLSHGFEDSNTSAVVRDITDPETQIRWEFDLWTSETSPVQLSSWIEQPSRGGDWSEGTIWRGVNRWNRDNRVTVTNDQANTWQSHVIDFYPFGLRAEDRIERAMLFEGFAVEHMFWLISTEDWGHDAENIFRIDNVKMSVIPEPEPSGISGIRFGLFEDKGVIIIGGRGTIGVSDSAAGPFSGEIDLPAIIHPDASAKFFKAN